MTVKNITVSVEDRTGNSLPRDRVTGGHVDGLKYTFFVSFLSRSPSVDIDGKTYEVSSAEIVKAIVEQHISHTRRT